MDHNARGRAGAVAQAVGVNGAKRMLDLGGGSATYSIAFAKAAPGLHAEVVDLADVLPIAPGLYSQSRYGPHPHHYS